MSGYLLDTNILSELAKPEPDKNVVRFLRNLENAYISVLTIHELTFGIELLPQKSKRQETLSKIVEELVAVFQDTILPIDQMEARIAGEMRADAQKEGRTIHVIDSLIAATAFAKSLSVVTRNAKDFADLPINVINPWSR